VAVTVAGCTPLEVNAQGGKDLVLQDHVKSVAHPCIWGGAGGASISLDHYSGKTQAIIYLNSQSERKLP